MLLLYLLLLAALTALAACVDPQVAICCFCIHTASTTVAAAAVPAAPLLAVVTVVTAATRAQLYEGQDRAVCMQSLLGHCFASAGIRVPAVLTVKLERTAACHDMIVWNFNGVQILFSCSLFGDCLTLDHGTLTLGCRLQIGMKLQHLHTASILNISMASVAYQMLTARRFWWTDAVKHMLLWQTGRACSNGCKT